MPVIKIHVEDDFGTAIQIERDWDDGSVILIQSKVLTGVLDEVTAEMKKRMSD